MTEKLKQAWTRLEEIKKEYPLGREVRLNEDKVTGYGYPAGQVVRAIVRRWSVRLDLADRPLFVCQVAFLHNSRTQYWALGDFTMPGISPDAVV